MRRRSSAGFVIALLIPSALCAQGYTGEVRVRGSFLDVREVVRDSLPESQVPGDDLQRTLEDGTVVTCVPGQFCRWFASGSENGVSLITQDLRVSAWPGVRGVAAHVLLRGRYGSDDFWPRTSSELEAVYAYVDYDRPDYRLRGGRLFRTNALGYYNFDGGSVLWRGIEPLRVDVFGGWSLARSLNQSRDGELLEEADDLATDDRALIVGVDVTARWRRVVTGTATYQREIRSDRLALYSERVAVGARALAGPASFDVAAKYDFAFGEFNEIAVRAATPLPARTDVAVHFRHYTPHFEMWTIWGAFSPVGYDEAGATLGWSVPRAALRLEGGGAYRAYEETNAGVEFVPFEEDGWRAFGRARWAREGWFAEGSYRAERGSGAARYGGDIAVGRAFEGGAFASVRGTSTQTFSEFRLGEQLLSGIGVTGAIPVGDLTLTGSYAVYDVSFDERPGFEDWKQHRGHVGVSYRIGDDPRASRDRRRLQ